MGRTFWAQAPGAMGPIPSPQWMPPEPQWFPQPSQAPDDFNHDIAEAEWSEVAPETSRLLPDFTASEARVIAALSEMG